MMSVASATNAPFQTSIEISLEKKRARDRRAQQVLREKRNKHINTLQEQLAARDAKIQELINACENLRQQNRLLLERQECVSSFIRTWQAWQQPEASSQLATASISVLTNSALSMDGSSDLALLVSPSQCLDLCPDISSNASSVPSFSNSAQVCGSTMDEDVAPILESVPLTTITDNPAKSNDIQLDFLDPDAFTGVFSSHVPSSPSTQIPPWVMIPIHSSRGFPGKENSSPWMLDPRLVQEVPDEPLPLEILYGSKSNPLTSLVHQRTTEYRIRKAESLAGGRLLYAIIKWTVDPDETKFSLLPDYLKPIQEQLLYPHPSEIDCIPWPSIRKRLILNLSLYNLSRVFDTLARCASLHWPWEKSVLEQGDDGEKWHISPELLRTSGSLDGWMLGAEFFQEYPELTEGLEARSMSNPD